ncbi:MAG: hypothetical protein SF029_11150 [bacterium]|nr:hypothetical protein [bacterium]
MGRNRIPEREPLGDSVEGVLIREGEAALLVSPAEGLPEGFAPAAVGNFVVRYAVPYLGKPQYAIVPGLVALDYGDILTGEKAWNFIYKRSNLHPRADVFGYRNDGSDEMISVKWLDLVLPVEVLLYQDAGATLPLAKLDAIISNRDDLPPRLLEYLPRYETLEGWRTRQTIEGET